MYFSQKSIDHRTIHPRNTVVRRDRTVVGPAECETSALSTGSIKVTSSGANVGAVVHARVIVYYVCRADKSLEVAEPMTTNNGITRVSIDVSAIVVTAARTGYEANFCQDPRC